LTLKVSVRFALQSANAGTGFWDLLAQIVEQPVPLPPPGAGMSQQLRDFLTCTLAKVRRRVPLCIRGWSTRSRPLAAAACSVNSTLFMQHTLFWLGMLTR